MSRKSHRTLAVHEIAISDAATLRLRTLGGVQAVNGVIRHVQAEWAQTPRRPGHRIHARIEIGDQSLGLIMGGPGPVFAVVGTPVETAVMYLKAVDPNAPGKISPLRRASIAQERTPMANQQELPKLVREHILAVYADVLEEATLIVALPKRMTKTTRGSSYQAERWFWNLRGDEPFLLLIALARPPREASDIVIAQAFRVPRAEVGDRQVLARYRTAKVNRVGSFLDRFAIKIPALASAPATPVVSDPPPPPAGS